MFMLYDVHATWVFHYVPAIATVWMFMLQVYAADLPLQAVPHSIKQ